MITLTSGSYSITLPNPALGDSAQANFKVKVYRAMDAGFYSYRQTPTIYKFLLTFSALRTTEKDDLLAFFADVAGETIIYTDYLNESWNVKLITTPIVSSQNYSYYFDLTIELEGNHA